jgi:hypothetical protein
MAKHANPEHFKITGDKRVRVVVEFAIEEGGGDTVALKNAMDYMTYFLNTNPRQHKSWGYSIEVQHDQG